MLLLLMLFLLLLSLSLLFLLLLLLLLLVVVVVAVVVVVVAAAVVVVSHGITPAQQQRTPKQTHINAQSHRVPPELEQWNEKSSKGQAHPEIFSVWADLMKSCLPSTPRDVVCAFDMIPSNSSWISSFKR